MPRTETPAGAVGRSPPLQPPPRFVHEDALDANSGLDAQWYKDMLDLAEVWQSKPPFSSLGALPPSSTTTTDTFNFPYDPETLNLAYDALLEIFPAHGTPSHGPPPAHGTPSISPPRHAWDDKRDPRSPLDRDRTFSSAHSTPDWNHKFPAQDWRGKQVHSTHSTPDWGPWQTAQTLWAAEREESWAKYEDARKYDPRHDKHDKDPRKDEKITQGPRKEPALKPPRPPNERVLRIMQSYGPGTWQMVQQCGWKGAELPGGSRQDLFCERLHAAGYHFVKDEYIYYIKVIQGCDVHSELQDIMKSIDIQRQRVCVRTDAASRRRFKSERPRLVTHFKLLYSRQPGSADGLVH